MVTAKANRSLESMNSTLQLVTKRGEHVLGRELSLKAIRQGKAKLVIQANNCPALRKSEIGHYTTLAKTGVHHDSGSNIELATTCGKYCRVCTLSITDPGDSGIIRSMPGQVKTKSSHSPMVQLSPLHDKDTTVTNTCTLSSKLRYHDNLLRHHQH
ncbi:large ribosomal subunit protein eL30-like [Lepus europaeus]|uniref:large ribosomal subunit protein eL30-like n=1 Tax=Lepus europaeus TaxID=9983 RepID=UPI002B4899E6|nr:large ribosomal subunit protein eL30-like [Lepus europaeus]